MANTYYKYICNYVCLAIVFTVCTPYMYYICIHLCMYFSTFPCRGERVWRWRRMNPLFSRGKRRKSLEKSGIGNTTTIIHTDSIVLDGSQRERKEREKQDRIFLVVVFLLVLLLLICYPTIFLFSTSLLLLLLLLPSLSFFEIDSPPRRWRRPSLLVVLGPPSSCQPRATLLSFSFTPSIIPRPLKPLYLLPSHILHPVLLVPISPYLGLECLEGLAPLHTTRLDSERWKRKKGKTHIIILIHSLRSF